jgi:hypothetical protein
MHCVQKKMSDGEELFDEENLGTNSIGTTRCMQQPSWPNTQVFGVDDDDNEDPFDRLEKLVLLHSASTKRVKGINCSPNTSISDGSEGNRDMKRPVKRDFTPPVIRFGPVPLARDAAKFPIQTATVVIQN